ncbi:MAG TPA: hypothetical protein VNI01_05560 [Elusimicrobiota bacterium]|nr:hypothetical protein [Elusimicrobiota bacterium]
MSPARPIAALCTVLLAAAPALALGLRMQITAPAAQPYLAAARSPELRATFAGLPEFDGVAEYLAFSHGLPAELEPKLDAAAQRFLTHNAFFFEALSEQGVRPTSIDPREASSDREAYGDEIIRFRQRFEAAAGRAKETARNRAERAFNDALLGAKRDLAASEPLSARTRAPEPADLDARAMEIETLLNFHAGYLPNVAQDMGRSMIERLEARALRLQTHRGRPTTTMGELGRKMAEALGRLGLASAGEAAEIAEPDHEPGTPKEAASERPFLRVTSEPEFLAQLAAAHHDEDLPPADLLIAAAPPAPARAANAPSKDGYASSFQRARATFWIETLESVGVRRFRGFVNRHRRWLGWLNPHGPWRLSEYPAGGTRAQRLKAFIQDTRRRERLLAASFIISLFLIGAGSGGPLAFVFWSALNAALNLYPALLQRYNRALAQRALGSVGPKATRAGISLELSDLLAADWPFFLGAALAVASAALGLAFFLIQALLTMA